MTAYAIVETALARLYGANADAQRGAFRGRIKHLQRLGLFADDKPGSGKRIDYGDDQIARLATALELTECGVDPTTIVNLISIYWKIMFEPWLKDDDQAAYSGERALVMSVRFMSSRWSEDTDVSRDFVTMSWFNKNEKITGIIPKTRGPILILDLPIMMKSVREQIKLEEERL